MAVLVLAACTDSAPLAPRPPAPAPVSVRELDCTASVADRSVRCGGVDAGGRGDIHVGGQGTYVQLTSGNVAYNAVSGTFSFDVSVQNLIPQPMGTADGATPSGTGVRVYFNEAPHALVGTVAPTDSLVSGYDGIATFSAPNQRYYQYSGGLLGGDGILSQNETSSTKGWTVHVPATVVSFAFKVLVSTEVPHPAGYVDVTPAADTATAGATVPLTAQVRSAVGDPIAGQTVTWGTSDAAVATVDGSGVVTAVGPGTVTITGTAGARSGTATLAVCPSLAVGGVYQAAAVGFCLAGGASGAEYTVVAQNQGTSAATAYSLTGSGIVAVTGPPTPDRMAGAGGLRVPMGPAADEAF
ncbi:MAG TPA: Ig-like domain-containing protein, partial [Longimicrobiaceae bacterium]|nr:Ig-like domain-containing protein [Longimicrobiaceae bacterium]